MEVVVFVLYWVFDPSRSALHHSSYGPPPPYPHHPPQGQHHSTPLQPSHLHLPPQHYPPRSGSSVQYHSQQPPPPINHSGTLSKAVAVVKDCQVFLYFLFFPYFLTGSFYIPIFWTYSFFSSLCFSNFFKKIVPAYSNNTFIIKIQLVKGSVSETAMCIGGKGFPGDFCCQYDGQCSTKAIGKFTKIGGKITGESTRCWE